MSISGDDDFFPFLAELHRAVHAVGLFLDDRLDGAVSQPEALVIAHLARGAATINDVHRAFLHRRSTLTSVLDRLERRGLVRRTTGGADRRSVRLELSAHGRRAADAIARALAELSQGSGRRPSAADAARLRSLAERAAALVRREDDPVD